MRAQMADAAPDALPPSDASHGSVCMGFELISPGENKVLITTAVPEDLRRNAEAGTTEKGRTFYTA